MAKEKETKKEEKEEYSRIDLKKKMDEITFKNDQVKMVRDLQSENAKLKQMVGRRGGRSQSSMPKIQGLATLKGNLGRQFQRRGVDY